MHASPLHYLPLAPLFYGLLALLLLIAVVLIELGVMHYTADRLGIGRKTVYLLLLFCLLGSYINIPVAELPPERVKSNEVVQFFGVWYVVPEVHQWPGTVLAVNVGGAVIPVLLSLYLLIRNRIYGKVFFGTLIVTAIVHLIATPVPGVGISVPILIPPLVAALVGVILGRAQSAPVAYVSGTLGTLLGADLLNLGALQGLGAPVASIGGAGTFDGVFLTGILAVLLS